jgi:VWFA-related protein
MVQGPKCGNRAASVSERALAQRHGQLKHLCLRFATPARSRSRLSCRLCAWLAAAALLVALLSVTALSQFKVAAELVLVDVTVVDRNGQPVKGLKPEQFQVFEDNRPQIIKTFEYMDIAAKQEEKNEPVAPVLEAGMLNNPAPEVIKITEAGPPDNMELARDKRLIFLFFDSSSMPPEDFVRVREAAETYISEKLTPADMVAVGLLGDTLRILQDFTNDRDSLLKAIKKVTPGEGTAVAEMGGVADLEAQQQLAESGEEDTDAAFNPDETELNIFNTDRKLGAIEVVSRTLKNIPGKKILVYFSNGIRQTGTDNQSQLRASVDAANRGNVSIYTVDARGLQASVPGGDARVQFTRGTALFSGRAQLKARNNFLNSQDTLFTIAQDTGGKALFDTNDLGEVFAQIQKDTAGYYLLGYYTQNPATDGKFRRIRVAVNTPSVRVKYRPGYYAAKEFRIYTREEREEQLREGLGSDKPFLDLRLAAEVNYFLAEKDVLAAVSLKIPPSQLDLPAQEQKKPLEFDVIGQVRDYDKKPAGALRETVRVKWEGENIARVKRGGVQYNGGFHLRPGNYLMKLVVRENRTGKVGTFEQDLTVPNLAARPVTISSVVLGSTAARDEKTHLEKVVPSVTRVFRNEQEMLVYFQAYHPETVPGSEQPFMSAGLVFFNEKSKAFETRLQHVRQFADPKTKAANFQLRVPLKGFAPGRYVVQVNVLDQVGGRASFARVPFAILPPARM